RLRALGAQREQQQDDGQRQGPEAQDAAEPSLNRWGRSHLLKIGGLLR
ncbi:MAG: hypothetical protein JWN08_85, partial [Frankiales bacterium]|nr:hypothetical protein [Frankiales bacterium]